MAVMQRLQQGIRALLAFSQDVDDRLAAQYLTDDQLRLFHAMALPEKLHVLNVLRDVLSQAEHTPHDLAVAALLHDCGKARYHMNLFERTLVVIVRAVLPPLYDRLSEPERVDTWHAAFAVYRYHPRWSAELVSQTDASERVVWLCAHHQDKPDQWRDHSYYPLLRRLKRADDAN